MQNTRRAMVVQLFIVVGSDVAAGKVVFEVLKERRVDGHYVVKMAMLGAVLDHQNLAIALDDLGLDFANLLIQKDLVRQLAVENLLAALRDALGAQRVGGARPAQGRLFLLPALQERLFAPLGGEGGVGADAVNALEDSPGALRRVN